MSKKQEKDKTTMEDIVEMIEYLQDQFADFERHAKAHYSKAGKIDMRLNELVIKFDRFRIDNEMSVTETFMFVELLRWKVKNEIDNIRQGSFIQGLGFDEVTNKVLQSTKEFMEK